MSVPIKPIPISEACEKYGVHRSTAHAHIESKHLAVATLMGRVFVSEFHFKEFATALKNGNMKAPLEYRKQPVGVTQKRVLELHARGLSNAQIAHELNIDPGGVTRFMKATGTERNRSTIHKGRQLWDIAFPERYEQAVELIRTTRLSIPAIARMCDVTSTTLKKTLIRNGVIGANGELITKEQS